MVDPVTIISGISLANQAFGEIKQLLANGRSVADCGKQLTAWARGCSQVQEDNNKQSLLGSNASQAAMDRLIHVQTIQRQREELREFMQLYGTSGSWNMFLQFEREARLQVKKEKEEAEKARRKRLRIIKNIAIAVLFSVLVGGIFTIGVMIFLSANQ
ncbi:MAG: hypothetical protein VW518_06645 [Burkholderiaceae bacterium]